MQIDRPIIAIDPGSTSVGWCVMYENGQVLSGFIKPMARSSVGVRLAYIRKEIRQALDERVPGHMAPLIVIESGISNRQAFTSGAVVDYSRGVIMEALACLFGGFETVRFIAPMSWKSKKFLEPYRVRLDKGEKPTIKQLKSTGLNICQEHIFCQDQIDAGFMAVYARDNFVRLMEETGKRTVKRKVKK